ncbi:MAG: PAS domain-containing sensor histidine kinase [Desulforhopalus sp.]|nr:PAS domain-containing sensor histidine kinase [Desulforhopalus sp.]
MSEKYSANPFFPSPMSIQTVTSEINRQFPSRKVPTPGESLIVDASGRIRFVGSHETFIGMTGLAPLHGRNLAEIFEPLLVPGDLQELMSLLVNSPQRNFTREFKTMGRNIRTLLIAGQPFPASDEERQWLLTTQDISDHLALINKVVTLEEDLEAVRQADKKERDEATASLIETNVALRKEIRDRQNTLERLSISEARFRDLTETTSDFIWEIDTAGTYTYASPKSVKLLGLQPQELIGTPLFLLRKAETTSQFINVIEFGGHPQRGFTKMEYQYLRDDGLEVTVESSGEPIFSKRNQFIGFRGIDRDVTERRIYETQLKEAKDLAESANLAKSEFLANMSHELRTPLHAILSFARYGEKRIESASRKEILRFFSQIAVSGERLLPLINGLLDLAKLESGKMTYDFQIRDLVPEIRSAIHEIMPLAEKKDLFIRFLPDNVATIACFDQTTIAQVIRNILGNAVKFSNNQTIISITFSPMTDECNVRYLQVTISNFGISIPEDELVSIFDKFAQSSKTKSGAGGTGLGLSICKQIIEDHLGKIWATHGENGETMFHFTLPTCRK